MNPQIRTRFAPSPTGLLHIGNARTAIINWLFARHIGGSFILRIEDTDCERSTSESERSILEDLRWLGLNWDEGADVGGAYGPYRQSERLVLYKEHLDRLLANGHVYPCFCTPEELDQRRKRLVEGETLAIGDRCRDLDPSERKRFESEGRKPAYRFRVDVEAVGFDDRIKGHIDFRGENIGDFIVVRPDGMPMYNFACTVDDHLMGITHIIRGDDHVSNTPRQVLLYKAFGWETPVFAHIPMILGKDRERLSKRHGATSVSQYRDMGYLPEAVVNYLSLLSWSSASGEEVLSVERLIKEFDFDRINASASAFDIEKLDWMNGMYIRNLTPENLNFIVFPKLVQAGFPVTSPEQTLDMSALFQSSLTTFSQVQSKAAVFFRDHVEFENDEARVLVGLPDSKRLYQEFMDETAGIKEWNTSVFQEIIKRIQKSTGISGKNLWMPIRAALTGQVHGPDLPRMAQILGLAKCRRFVEEALAGAQKTT